MMSADDFNAITVLGEGTFGAVYLVRRLKDRKPFVIKVQQLATTSLQMVLGEVRCLQKMRHPNIVAYHGAWREDNRCYILMEYATRGTLKDLLEKRGTALEEEDALYLFSQVVLGVHHIHGKKILHRDLKPDNIMLTGRRGDIVKIGDFGVSKDLQGNSTSRCAGTYHYMAPEMFESQPYDFRSDVWSMGVVLYQMIANRLPFPATSHAEIVEMACNGEPRPLAEATSREVVNLVSKMLRKRAHCRPRTSQLVLCPYLVPRIIRVGLNVGRCTNVIHKCVGSDLDFKIFLRYLKIPNFKGNCRRSNKIHCHGRNN